MSQGKFNDAWVSDANLMLEAVRRRNIIQETIITKADDSCRIHKRLLTALQADVGFSLSTISTITGGLATIFIHPEITRPLAGAAALSGGIANDFDKVFFQEQAAGVLISALDVKRGELHSAIKGKQGQTLDKYSLEEALADAINYVEACSVPAAFDKARDALAFSGVTNSNNSGGDSKLASGGDWGADQCVAANTQDSIAHCLNGDTVKAITKEAARCKLDLAKQLTFKTHLKMLSNNDKLCS